MSCTREESTGRSKAEDSTGWNAGSALDSVSAESGDGSEVRKEGGTFTTICMRSQPVQAVQKRTGMWSHELVVASLVHISPIRRSLALQTSPTVRVWNNLLTGLAVDKSIARSDPLRSQ